MLILVTSVYVDVSLVVGVTSRVPEWTEDLRRVSPGVTANRVTVRVQARVPRVSGVREWKVQEGPREEE